MLKLFQSEVVSVCSLLTNVSCSSGETCFFQRARHDVESFPFLLHNPIIELVEQNFNLPSIASTYLGIIHNVPPGRNRFDAFFILFTASSLLKNASHDIVFFWRPFGIFFGIRIFNLTFITRITGTFTIRIRDQTHIKEASTRTKARYVPRSSTLTSVSPKGKEIETDFFRRRFSKGCVYAFRR